jgi:hypothetical protein
MCKQMNLNKSFAMVATLTVNKPFCTLLMRELTSYA